MCVGVGGVVLAGAREMTGHVGLHVVQTVPIDGTAEGKQCPPLRLVYYAVKKKSDEK